MSISSRFFNPGNSEENSLHLNLGHPNLKTPKSFMLTFGDIGITKTISRVIHVPLLINFRTLLGKFFHSYITPIGSVVHGTVHGLCQKSGSFIQPRSLFILLIADRSFSLESRDGLKVPVDVPWYWWTV